MSPIEVMKLGGKSGYYNNFNRSEEDAEGVGIRYVERKDKIKAWSIFFIIQLSYEANWSRTLRHAQKVLPHPPRKDQKIYEETLGSVGKVIITEVSRNFHEGHVH